MSAAMELTKKVRALLTRYAERRLKRADVATRLKITERQVNRLMTQVHLERKESESASKRTEAAKRRLARSSAARAVHAGNITIEQAAKRAGCSERTIYRYLDRM
jgi:AraC-like DNA-binding protein